jgi:sugar diacid utilization regulator
VIESSDLTSTWTSYCQLVQQLAMGSVRRNTFTKLEMELLLDFQMARIRTSSRAETLRRYLRALQQQLAQGEPIPQRFSRFIEREIEQRKMAEALAQTRRLARAS